MKLLIASTPTKLSRAGIAIDLVLLLLLTLLIISRHANKVSGADIVFDLFLIFILPLPLEACTRCISGSAWSWTLIFLHKVDAGV